MNLILFIPILIYVIYWIIVDYFFNVKAKNSFCSPSEKCSFCTIVICAYNEEENISECLHDILNQKNINQHAEIILIDDGSTDKTYALASEVLSKSSLPYQIIRNEENIGKKRSIEKAVKLSNVKSEWIILRDADTTAISDKWFISLIQKMNKNSDLIIAPVITLVNKNSLTDYLQYFEGLALINLSLGSLNMNMPILCNAANMAFRKSKFEQLNPFEDNHNIYTGDDIFLLHKMHSTKCNIISAFEKENIVLTHAPKNLKKMFIQKQRWISKTKHIQSIFNKISALIIAFTNITLMFTAFYSAKLFLILLFIKILIDLKVLFSVQKKLQLAYFQMTYFLIVELLYIPYVCALVLIYFFQKEKNDK